MTISMAVTIGILIGAFGMLAVVVFTTWLFHKKEQKELEVRNRIAKEMKKYELI